MTSLFAWTGSTAPFKSTHTMSNTENTRRERFLIFTLRILTFLQLFHRRFFYDSGIHHCGYGTLYDTVDLGIHETIHIASYTAMYGQISRCCMRRQAGFQHKRSFFYDNVSQYQDLGSTNNTRTMEMMVPRPRHSPIDATTGFEESKLIRIPAEASMVPEVRMVGNA